MWLEQEASFHINILDSQAIYGVDRFGIRSVHSGSHTYQQYHPNVLCEQQGRACSNQLCKEAIKFWYFCIKEDIPIAVQLPRPQNWLADQLSRCFS